MAFVFQLTQLLQTVMQKSRQNCWTLSNLLEYLDSKFPQSLEAQDSMLRSLHGWQKSWPWMQVSRPLWRGTKESDTRYMCLHSYSVHSTVIACLTAGQQIKRSIHNKVISLTQAQYSLTVEFCGLKHHSFTHSFSFIHSSFIQQYKIIDYKWNNFQPLCP